MTDEELADTERKAKAASGWPWEFDGEESVCANDPESRGCYDVAKVFNPDVGAFIAAANPQVVQALVAEVRRLRGLLDLH